MNNKIHKVNSDSTPNVLKATYGPATSGVEFESAAGKKAVRVVPDSKTTERYLVPVLYGAGAPTNGTAGTGAGYMDIGNYYWDTTNKASYVNTGTLLSPVWSLEGVAVPSVVPLSADGAVTQGSVNAINKGSAAALTIAAPTAGAPGTGDDGKVTTLTSDSAFAHVLTFTGSKLDSGAAAVLTATFNPFKGASLTVMAFNGRFKVLNANGVSFT